MSGRPAGGVRTAVVAHGPEPVGDRIITRPTVPDPCDASTPTAARVTDPSTSRSNEVSTRSPPVHTCVRAVTVGSDRSATASAVSAPGLIGSLPATTSVFPASSPLIRR